MITNRNVNDIRRRASRNETYTKVSTQYGYHINPKFTILIYDSLSL